MPSHPPHTAGRCDYTRASSLQAAIGEIRKLHRPVLPPGIERCGDCDVPWPCETIAILDRHGL
ncbi:hypothetical protein [Mycobacterium talmoniae]|uniref:Uncharacterized protein n=1 Tax=Mycobacterium talmoniae TaxID=1858794 RepID=A0A1S1NKJ4_9MYCO|nr:hypothetical protein [Mycobacterium talmoniae]OHV03704.1 hypothetical protein BKN37_13605 [Mycobacterium talmoniae]